MLLLFYWDWSFALLAADLSYRFKVTLELLRLLMFSLRYKFSVLDDFGAVEFISFI